MPRTFTLVVEYGDAGLWYVTSPELKGLLVAESTPWKAIRAVPDALHDLALARSVEQD